MAPLRTTRRRRATVVIETAIILPWLLLLVFGLIEYGWLMHNQQLIINAARHGARIGARIDATNGDVTTAVQEAMDAAGLGGSGYTLEISPDVGEMNGGAALTVTVSVVYANIDLGMTFVPTPVNLVGTVIMAKEGFRSSGRSEGGQTALRGNLHVPGPPEESRL